MKKISNIVMLVLVAVALVSIFLYLFGGNINNMEANVAPMLYVAYAFLAISIIALIGMAAMNIGKGKGNSKLGLIVFGGLAVLAVILWVALSKSTPVTGADGTVFSDAFTLKATDTGLYLTYATLALTVIFLLWGIVRKALK